MPLPLRFMHLARGQNCVDDYMVAAKKTAPKQNICNLVDQHCAAPAPDSAVVNKKVPVFCMTNDTIEQSLARGRARRRALYCKTKLFRSGPPRARAVRLSLFEFEQAGRSRQLKGNRVLCNHRSTVEPVFVGGDWQRSLYSRVLDRQ